MSRVCRVRKPSGLRLLLPRLEVELGQFGLYSRAWCKLALDVKGLTDLEKDALHFMEVSAINCMEGRRSNLG